MLIFDLRIMNYSHASPLADRIPAHPRLSPPTGCMHEPLTKRLLWLGGVILGITLLTGCSAIKQALQNQPCVLNAVVPYDTLHINPARHHVSLHWKHPMTHQPFETIQSVTKWLEDRGDSILAVTNAGIFEPGLIPTGLYVENGHELRPLNMDDGDGNFYLKPNGVFFAQNHQFKILSTAQFDAQRPTVETALQSGPLLLQAHQVHPAFTPGSRNCRLRSGIGLLANGHAIIAISNGAVNFYDFATWFRDVVRATDALYLDGSISVLHTGLQPGRSEQRYAGFLAVTAKRK